MYKQKPLNSFTREELIQEELKYLEQKKRLLQNFDWSSIDLTPTVTWHSLVPEIKTFAQYRTAWAMGRTGMPRKPRVELNPRPKRTTPYKKRVVTKPYKKRDGPNKNRDDSFNTYRLKAKTLPNIVKPEAKKRGHPVGYVMPDEAKEKIRKTHLGRTRTKTYKTRKDMNTKRIHKVTS